MEKEKEIKTLEELEEKAARFVGELSPKEDGATLVTLSGELGAGKTAFTKAVAKVLCVEETVTSPTFVLEKIYELPEQGRQASCGRLASTDFKRLVHIDAYRLESGADLAALGFDEIMHNAGNLILLEWPERVADNLPKQTCAILIQVNPDNSRTLSYSYV